MVDIIDQHSIEYGNISFKSDMEVQENTSPLSGEEFPGVSAEESGVDDNEVIVEDVVVESVKEEEGESKEVNSKQTYDDKETLSVEVKNQKKVGPQKQRALIHSLLKRAKIYEIRKLTRRISVLKMRKGTELQMAKNNRKVDRIVNQIKAMREFMIDNLTSRTIDVFKGKADQIYLDLWAACSDAKKVSDMIQIFAETESDKNFDHMAYLRMLSSQDLYRKFENISKGVNITPPKTPKKTSRKKIKNADRGKAKNVKEEGGRKKKPLSSTDAKLPDTDKEPAPTEVTSESRMNFTGTNDDTTTTIDVLEGKEIAENKVTNTKVRNTKIDEKEIVKNKTLDNKEKRKSIIKPKRKEVYDNFFMDNAVVLSDPNDNSDEEFSAPVDQDKVSENAVTKKKNRMGQRERKKLYNKQFDDNRNKDYNKNYKGRDFKSKDFRGRDFKSKDFRGRDFKRPRSNVYGERTNGNRNAGGFTKDKTFKKTTEMKKVDENLHPSWQAKQRQKAQQGIASFAGTKITFD